MAKFSLVTLLRYLYKKYLGLNLFFSIFNKRWDNLQCLHILRISVSKLKIETK